MVSIIQVININECLNSLTVMTKAGCADQEKEQVIKALEIQEFCAVSDELFYRIKNALIMVAAIRAFGVSQNLQNYFGDTK